MRYFILIALLCVIGCELQHSKEHDDEIRRRAVGDVLDKQLQWLNKESQRMKDQQDEEEGIFRI